MKIANICLLELSERFILYMCPVEYLDVAVSLLKDNCLICLELFWTDI